MDLIGPYFDTILPSIDNQIPNDDQAGAACCGQDLAEVAQRHGPPAYWQRVKYRAVMMG